MTKILTKKEYNQLSEDEKTMASLISDIVTAKEDIAKNILEIGNKLYVAKQLVPHGEWESWLAEKVDFSVRSAQTYIKTYKIMMDLPEELDSTLGKLGSSKLVEIATIKKDDIEGFITSTHSVDGTEKTVDEMSVRELKEVIKENKKSKKKSKQNKNADVCVNETEKVVDVDFKESQQEESTLTEEQKLSKIIKEQQELEQQLKIKQRQAKETKESILRNKKSLDLKVEFEEIIEPYLGIKTLYYNIYLIRSDNVKELVYERCHYSSFKKMDISDDYDYIVAEINRNYNLMREEKDFIIGECLKFKDGVNKRYEEINEERENENKRTWEKIGEDFVNGFSEMFNELNKPQEPQGNKDLKKEFIIAGYKALAKKYHPDRNQGNAEAEDKFKAVGIFKDILLQQNLLN